MRLSVGAHRFAPPAPGGLKTKVLGPRTSTIAPTTDRPILDLRAGHPENWAHFLNIHLALLALAARTLKVGPLGFCILLPRQTPGYVRALVDLLGLECLYTDDVVKGFGVEIGFEDWNCIRAIRSALLTDPGISPVAAALQDGTIPTADTPPRLFVSRKGTRALTNEAEIAGLLAPAGFETVYMEELSTALQLRTLINARQVVAVHGAALAPLLYRGPEAEPVALIELFPVGHLTNVYRAVIAAQQGRWCGVRGHITPRNLSEIYKLGQPYLKHSLDTFTVDPEAVKIAQEIVGEQGSAPSG